MTDVRTPAAENPAVETARDTTTTSQGWSKHDTTWMLGLYGTAIGAGTLFLPINAGVGGFWPLIVLALLAFPMTFFAHRGLTRFVLSGRSGDITEVVEEHFGIGAGKLITLLYFFAIFPILLVYSVALTNTLGSFMEHQLHMTPPPRAVLSLVLILGLMAIVRCGQGVIVRAMSVLVYPFVAALLLLALSLIPNWNGAFIRSCPETGSQRKTDLLVRFFSPPGLLAGGFPGMPFALQELRNTDVNKPQRTACQWSGYAN